MTVPHADRDRSEPILASLPDDPSIDPPYWHEGAYWPPRRLAESVARLEVRDWQARAERAESNVRGQQTLIEAQRAVIDRVRAAMARAEHLVGQKQAVWVLAYLQDDLRAALEVDG